MLEDILKIIQVVSALDMRLVALLVIALAIIAVVVITNGLGR